VRPLGTAAAELADARLGLVRQSCSCGMPPGACRTHPRARLSQRPAGDWRVWGTSPDAGGQSGPGCWIQARVEAGIMKLGCLIAPTTADIRDVMVDALRLLAVATPCATSIRASKRRVVWPNAAFATPCRGRCARAQPPPGPCFGIW